MPQKRLFYISAVGYLLSSVSVILMGLGDMSGKAGNPVAAVLSAMLFWFFLLIAVTAQLLLRRLQKPYRQKLSVFILVLSPPTVFFEAGFLFGLTAVILMTTLNINGFVFLIFLFFILICFELTLLTMGKFRIKNQRIILKIYKIKLHIRSGKK